MSKIRNNPTENHSALSYPLLESQRSIWDSGMKRVCTVNRICCPVVCVLGIILFGSISFYIAAKDVPLFSNSKHHILSLALLIGSAAMVILATIAFVAYGIWHNSNSQALVKIPSEP